LKSNSINLLTYLLTLSVQVKYWGILRQNIQCYSIQYVFGL